MKYQIDKSIRRDVAKCMVKMSDPGYLKEIQGDWYVVDTDGDQMFDTIMDREYSAPWNPWPDNAVAIPLDALYDHSSAVFDWTECMDCFEGTPSEEEKFEQAAYEAAILLAADELLDEYEIDLETKHAYPVE